MTNQMSRSEMPIPMPKGAIIAAILMFSFIGFFVVLGMKNLMHGAAIIASGIWLFLVGAFIWLAVRYEGARKVLVSFLGCFASKHFVESVPRGSMPAEIRFGYRFLGQSFFYLTISVDKIEAVNWSTGQASHFAKRELDDWSVVLWYDHGDPVKSRQQQKQRNPDQEVYIVGPERRKELTAAFGLTFLDFLRQAGASFVQGEDERHFVRAPAGGEPAGRSA